jgi:hypothetical protein
MLHEDLGFSGYHYSMNQLLLRSDEFQTALNSILNVGTFALLDDTPKHLICVNACRLSLNHAGSARILFADDAPNFATGLLRLQYLDLLRAAWILHAANDLQLSKLTAQLGSQTKLVANNSPEPAEMFKALEAIAPIEVIQPLNEFKAVALEALNDFVPESIDTLMRIKEALPEVLVLQLIRNSNGLIYFGYRMLASLNGSQALTNQMTHLHGRFADCFPPPNKP